MSRLVFTRSQDRCVRLAGKLMQESEMLHSGAKVGVAVSGGVDSWVLLQVLLLRQRIVPFPFEVTALHINPGFNPNNHEPLLTWAKTEGVQVLVENTEHGPRAHSDENKVKSTCFYCSMLRRTSLFKLCEKHEFTHLAFGHNADDLVSTFFMNLFESGRVQGLSFKEPFFQGKLTVIRPLGLVEKKLIVNAAESWQLPVWQSDCPSAKITRRAEVMQDVHNLCKGHRVRRKNIFNGLVRWQYARHVDKKE